MVFWNVALCCVLAGSQRFGGRAASIFRVEVRTEADASTAKCWFPATTPHAATTQKMTSTFLFINTKCYAAGIQAMLERLLQMSAGVSFLALSAGGLSRPAHKLRH